MMVSKPSFKQFLKESSNMHKELRSHRRRARDKQIKILPDIYSKL